ncbi:hypothetical protein ACHAW6_000683, partial [Cyclotella cf. meneghiniana]
PPPPAHHIVHEKYCCNTRSATIALKKDHGDASKSRDCKCSEKLFFCGYDMYLNDSNNKSRSEDVPSGNTDRNARGELCQSIKEPKKYLTLVRGIHYGVHPQWQMMSRGWDIVEWKSLSIFGKQFYPVPERDSAGHEFD